MLTRRALALAPIAAGVVGVLAALAAAPAARAASVRAEAGAEARTTYLADCATCHGPTGAGTSRGPTLRGVGRASIDFMVRTGRMPLDAPDDRPMRGPSPYDPAAQAALIDYATALAGGGPAIPRVSLAGADVAAGGEAYRLQCAACHSWGGNGGALVGREAPPVQPATPVEVAEAIRIGPGEMPAFGTAAVSDRQLADLVAFTTSLDRPDDRGGADLGHLGPVAEGAVALVVGLGLLVLSVLWIGERT